MALDAAHRASIYLKLRPILGEEDANVLMSEFPSVEAQELVTKDFLRGEMSELRLELAALENRLTLRLGSAIAASAALLAAIGIFT